MRKPRKELLAATALSMLFVSCDNSGRVVAPPPAPTTGTVDLTVMTSGSDPDSDGYTILVDTLLYVVPAPKPSAVNGSTSQVSVVVPPLPVGTHTLTLKGIASNCIVSGTNPRQFEITGGAKTGVTLDVQCLFTGVEVSARTTGFDYPGEYDVVVDGRSVGSVGANDSMAFRVAAGTHAVRIGTRAENCAAAGGAADTVTVVSRSITSLAFAVSCARAVRRERIAYAVDTIVGGVGGSWIVVVNTDGSGASPIARGDSPSWSPDGTKLAYSNALCDPYARYYGYPCGGNIEVIDPERWHATVMLYGGSGLSPAWSPTGETIAFTKCCVNEDRGRVYLANTDGLTPAFPIGAGGDVGEPSWSPDGLFIVFNCTGANGTAPDLCIASRNGTGVKALGISSASPASPAWSPDGKRIAFTSTTAQSAWPQVALVDVNTLSIATLTDGRDPAWSPDGTKIVMAGADGLYVINADGTNKTRITKGAQRAPAWRP